MDIFQAILLGIIQGLTEWLPVSSSAHLVFAKHYFGVEQNIFYDVMLHFATLVVVVFVFKEDIYKILISIFRKEMKEERRMLLLLIIGTIFTAIIGFVFKNYFESLFENVILVATFLLITGVLLFIAEFEKFERKKDIEKEHAGIIGIIQGIAIAPGVSRSGSTISIALILGIKREFAIKFSFLLSIPIIIGATIVKLKDVSFDISNMNLANLIVGMVVSAIVGYFSIKLLINFVKEKKLRWFSYYCFILGLVVIAIEYLR